MKFKIGTIHCPDWMDKPLQILIPTLWILLVISLAIALSPWWLFLVLLTPFGKVNLTLKREKEKTKRLLEWKISLKKERLKEGK